MQRLACIVGKLTGKGTRVELSPSLVSPANRVSRNGTRFGEESGKQWKSLILLILGFRSFEPPEGANLSPFKLSMTCKGFYAHRADVEQAQRHRSEILGRQL